MLIEDDYFGWSVAIGGLGESDGVAFVGVPGWAREDAPLSSGAVYVFTPDSSGVPTEAGIITPSSGPLTQRIYGNRHWILTVHGLLLEPSLSRQEEDDAGQPIAGHGAVYVYDIGLTVCLQTSNGWCARYPSRVRALGLTYLSMAIKWR